jgi:group I intron endonuclease
LVYLHVARGLYYGSYRSPRTLTWIIGTIILIALMATGFLGYLVNSLTWIEYDSGCLLSFPIVASARLSCILDKYNKLTPIGIWENLQDPNVKAQVVSDLKSYAGVYVIVNLVNGNMYVGSAISKKIAARFRKHLYGGSGSKIVNSAVQKYGLSNFAFILVDTVSYIVTKEDNQTLLSLENHYINMLKPKYNIAPQAGNTFGFRFNHTGETKYLMKLNYSSERREMIGSLNRGKKLSPETIELLRAAAQARPPMSDETRLKVSNNSAAAFQYEISKPDGSSFLTQEGILVQNMLINTTNKVAKFCNVNEKTVRRALAKDGIVVQVASRNPGLSLAQDPIFFYKKKNGVFLKDRSYREGQWIIFVGPLIQS